jgi:hypothetical protein
MTHAAKGHVMDDISEITQLVLRERQGRDRGWWAQELACFAEDSRVRESWIDGSGRDFVQQSMGHPAPLGSGHRMAAPVIQLRGNRAVVEVGGVIEVRTVVAGTLADHVAHIRMVYRVEKRDGGAWLVGSLDCIYQFDTLAPVHPGAQIDIDQEKIASYRESYRFLAYAQASAGRTPRDDLYGDDRPEELRGLYAELFEWLGAPVPTEVQPVS